MVNLPLLKDPSWACATHLYPIFPPITSVPYFSFAHQSTSHLGLQKIPSFPCSPGSSKVDGLKTIFVGSLDRSSTLDFGSSIYQFIKNSVFTLKDPKPGFTQRRSQSILPLSH